MPGVKRHIAMLLMGLLLGGFSLLWGQQSVAFTYQDDKGEQAEGSLSVYWKALKANHSFFDFSKIPVADLEVLQGGQSYLEISIEIENWEKNYHRRIFELVVRKRDQGSFSGLKWEAPQEVIVHRNGSGIIRFRVTGRGEGTLAIPFGIRSTETGELQAEVGVMRKPYRIRGLNGSTEPAETAEAAWEKTRRQNTREGYLRFLQAHPNSDFDSLANKALDELLWQQVTRTDNPQAYRQYLADRPQGKFASEARQVLADRQAWEQAYEEGSQQAFQKYLDAFPQGRYRSEAEAYLDYTRQESRPSQEEASSEAPSQAEAVARAWREVSRKEDPAAYRAFIQEHPHHPSYRRKAEDAITRLSPMELRLEREGNRFHLYLTEVNRPRVVEVIPEDSISYRWAVRERHVAELVVELEGKQEYQLTIVDRDNDRKQIFLALAEGPLRVSEVSYDSLNQALRFQVKGGKKPYAIYFQRKDGSLLSSPLPLDVDSGFKLNQLLPLIRSADGEPVEVYLTDASRLEQVLVKDNLHLPANGGWPLWAILLGPLLLSVGFIILRNR
jgi:hypothetical protein